ncbi:MAG: Minichromosome maintenance protein MCM [Candidatus Thorarchaeota archaeon]|nr:MAG: Minichromosome maintenance protein MCM [Candidatus Thorarchaeota archaeon]
MTTETDSLDERFKEFLRSYTDEQGTLPYWTRVQKMPLNDETSLSVDFQDLASFDIIFKDEAANDPIEFLKSFNRALVSVMNQTAQDYVSDIGEDIITIRITNYFDTVPLRAIRSRHIGHLIRISGIMMRASEVKPLLVKAVFECRICSNQLSHELEGGRYSEPVMCPTCMKKTPLKLLPESSQFIDWQRVRIQESPEELPPGQMPRSVDVTLEGDIVDISRPGDLVKVTGILQTTPDFSRRGGKLATFNIFIKANGVEITEKEYEQLEITDAEEKRIRELSEDPYIHERIFASIAPSIHGHEVIKESIALLLFGGVGKTLADGTRLRGRSNILMIGDPGTGKSQILKFVAKLASRSLYTSGKGTTAAGLTAAVVHDTDTGSMTLEAGALVLADQGIACIDEFDKMDPNDRTAIHEAMEQHTVSIAKAGIVATLNARTSILAAANPTLGRYDLSSSVQDNIKLPFTILSRFDLIWILIDTVEEKKDRELAQFILGMHREQATKANESIPPIEPDFLKKYIGYANMHYRPRLTAEAAEVIEAFYVGLRSRATGGSAPVPITARQLEALVRLSEARARISLSPEVSREDAQAAVRLMEESLKMVAFDPIKKTIDIDRIVSPISSSQRNASETILTAMKEFEAEGKSSVEKERLLQKVGEMGLSKERAEEALGKLLSEGILFNPGGEKIKRP